MFGYNKKYLITHPHIIAREIYYYIKWFIQRGHRGYADCDVWGLDSYLCDWLPAALRELASDIGGVPCDLAKINKDGTHDVTDKEINNWKAQLRIIADGFEARKHISECDYKHDSKEEKEAIIKSDIGMKLFVERFDSLWN